MRLTARSKLLRSVKLLALGHLAGGCIFGVSCGDQIRRGVLTGVSQFVTGSTSQLVAEALSIEDVLRDLLTADSNGPNAFPIN